MNTVLRNMINQITELGEILDDKGIGCGSMGISNDTSNQMRLDLVSFLCYLISADKQINNSEIKLLRDFFDYYTTRSALTDYINVNLKSSGFREKTPISFQVLVNADILIKQHSIDNVTNSASALYSIYRMIGLEMLACDEETTEEETGALTHYLDNMYQYASSCGITISEDNFTDVDKIALENSKNNIEACHENENETLESLINKLNDLVGLAAVKSDLKSLINLIRVKQIREQRGLKQQPLSLHLVFSGNPGTGKTTVARLLARIYHKLGILTKGHLVEVDRSGLVGGYVGQTAIKVKEVVNSALGGILFIDEAYSLSNGRSSNDYGQEAIETLLKSMEDSRANLVVIVAGYPKLMEEFLGSNPGLRSRFNKFIFFNDYSASELLDIFTGMCKGGGFALTSEAYEYVKKTFIEHLGKNSNDYANGRDARNLFEKVLVNQANRLADDPDLTDDELILFTLDDVVDTNI